MIRDHYRNTEIRKAELDPATFDHAEQYQMTPRDYRIRAWVWRAIFAWCVAFPVGIAWLIFG